MMKFAIPAIAAAVVAFSVAGTAANAAPVTASAAAATDGFAQHSTVQRVDNRDRGHWVPGRRYKDSPPGWHRYDRRPSNWRTRGCVIVGPIWFCP